MEVNQLSSMKRMNEDEKYMRTTQSLKTTKEGSNPQQQMQVEMLKQATTGNVVGTDNNLQKQLLQMMAAASPVQQIQSVAQNQISKGYLDIKV
ncbi:MAG: hypothetical protein ACPL1A_05530 [Candidatus Kapaibacteriota bacterium]